MLEKGLPNLLRHVENVTRSSDAGGGGLNPLPH